MSISIFCTRPGSAIVDEGAIVDEDASDHPGDMNLASGRFFALMTPLLQSLKTNRDTPGLPILDGCGVIDNEDDLLALLTQIDCALRRPHEFYQLDETDADTAAYLWRRLRALRALVNHAGYHGYHLAWG